MIGTSGSQSTYSDTISGMIRFICLGLILLLLVPPGLAVEVHEHSGLYSDEFWQEVRAELQKEVQPKVDALLAGGYSNPVTGDSYASRHSVDDAEYNQRRSEAFWARVAQRKERINFYQYQAPPGNREFELRAVLEENTRASYRSVTQIAHILAPMAEGHSSNKSINRETIQGEIEDNIIVAENDPRTAEALQHLKRANEELKQARVQFVSGNYQGGQEHLGRAKTELVKANEAANRLRAIVEAAIAAGNLIARVASKNRSTFIPPVANNIPNSGYPPVAPPIARRNTTANVIPPNSGQQASPPRTGYENIDRRLLEYAEELRQEAKRQQSDPYLQATIVHNVDEKFTGIWLGLVEAKDEIKAGAAKAFMSVANKKAEFDRNPAGTANSTLIASVEFGTRFANETMKAVDAAANDAAAFDKVFKESVATASHEYAQKSPREQGKAIGNFILWNKLFSGTTQFNSVAGNAFNRAKTALAPHAQKIQQTVRQVATASKSTVGAAKQRLNQLAANLGGQRQMVPAGAGGYGNVAYKPPDSFYSVRQPGSAGGNLPGRSGSRGGGGLSSGVKTGTSFGNVIVDDSPIASGVLKGQRPSEGLKWPAGWRKPKKGDFFSSNGKLYFKPDEQFRKRLKFNPNDVVPYTEKGVPDFIQWTPDKQVHQYKGTLTGFPIQDANLLAGKLASENWHGLKTQVDVLEEFKRMKVTVHHFDVAPDGTHHLQLVDSFIHNEIRHTGTAKMIKDGLY